MSLLEHTLAPATRLCMQIIENNFDIPESSKCNNIQLSVTRRTQLEHKVVVTSCAVTVIYDHQNFGSFQCQRCQARFRKRGDIRLTYLQNKPQKYN
jgi:hypothetical protein